MDDNDTEGRGILNGKGGKGKSCVGDAIVAHDGLASNLGRGLGLMCIKEMDSSWIYTKGDTMELDGLRLLGRQGHVGRLSLKAVEEVGAALSHHATGHHTCEGWQVHRRLCPSSVHQKLRVCAHWARNGDDCSAGAAEWFADRVNDPFRRCQIWHQ